MFYRQASLRDLAGLSRRLATSLHAGIDLRKAFEREAQQRSRTALGERLHIVYDGLAAGQTLPDAMQDTGRFFPPMFRDLVEVGYETGQTAEVFRQLADHYDHVLQMRRTFLASITWPLLQLIAAVFIIGVTIWLMGILPASRGGEPIDIMGLGVTGAKGAMLWFAMVATVAAGAAVVVIAMQRGVLWTRPLQKILLQIPVLGPALQTLALSQMAWALFLTLNTSLDLRRSLGLSIRSTRNARYTDGCDQVIEEVMAGNEIYEALAHTGAYPVEFIDALEVGEKSGSLPEQMRIVAEQYQDQARRAIAVLTTVAGFAVWGLVAMLIILAIFKVFFFYLNTINSLTQGL